MILFLLSFFLFNSVWADQPFEPLFINGGIAPVHYHPAHSNVRVLQSPEQFVQCVAHSSDTVMVYLDKSSRNTHAIDLQAVVDLAQRWPQPLRVVTVDAATHLYLIKAVAHAGGIASLTLPCVVVFVKGKAVVPPIMMGGDFEHEVVKRIAFAQQHRSHHSQDSWWHWGVSLVQCLWHKISQYLFG